MNDARGLYLWLEQLKGTLNGLLPEPAFDRQSIVNNDLKPGTKSPKIELENTMHKIDLIRKHML